MKKIAAIFALLVFPFTALACPGGSTKVCPQDIVYFGDIFFDGAEVLAVNRSSNRVTVRGTFYFSGRPPKLVVESVPMEKVSVTDGCIEGVCVGDSVMMGNFFAEPAKVVAINLHSGRVTVKSEQYPFLTLYAPERLDVTRECLKYGSNERKLSVKDSRSSTSAQKRLANEQLDDSSDSTNFGTAAGSAR